MRRLRVWLLASRPATLTAAVAPLGVGGALALRDGVADAAAWSAALLGALFIQLGTNYANDVFDFEKGADTAARVGPVRATQAGLVSPRAMRVAMGLAFACAALCGSHLVWRAGWPIALLGAASIASGVAYTGGPWPLGYHGLGDVFVFVFFGIAATVGTYFVEAGHTTADAWIWSVSVGASCTAILVVNNVRDVETDRQAGKRTLAVRWGVGLASGEYALLLGLATLLPLGMALWQTAPWLALPSLIAPLAWRHWRALAESREPQALNVLLAATARLHLVSGLLISAAILLDARGR